MATKTVKDRKPPKRLAYLPKPRGSRLVRADHAIKLREMASAIHRDIAHVCDVLNGNKNSLVIATEAAEFFGVPIEGLFIIVDLEAIEQDEYPHS